MPNIYFDNHATTPLDPRVKRAMDPYLGGRFGNPSSLTHAFGREAARAVECARLKIARLVNARPSEITFTSGATESNNLAIKGVMASRGGRGHIITVTTEHKSVLDPIKRLALGVGATTRVAPTYLSVDADGLIDMKALERAITPKTVLISVMAANNETGVLQPLAKIGRLARRRGILFHTDAAQAAGKVPIDVKAMRIDLMSFNAHKLYGPKGVGALYVRSGCANLVPLFDGGGQEGGLRPGTPNVPGIMGFAEAAGIARAGMRSEAKWLAGLRDRLLRGLVKEIPGLRVNGSLSRRLPNNLNVSFPGIEARRLMEALPGIALSSGSACLSTSPEPSYVLKAMGLDQARRHGSVRFGLGRFNTAREVDRAKYAIIRAFRGE